MKRSVRICTIGGGSGMPIVNRALVKAGYKDIVSIVTTFDSGGDSGRIRTDERGRVLAFSDYWRALMSLWKDGKQKEGWEEMLKFRDGRGRNFGNTFFQFMSERCGNLGLVDSLFSKLTNADLRGEVVPVALSPADICFRTESGREYCGEHQLDNLRMSEDKVEKMRIEPRVEANQEALEVLRTARVIIVCPGSMYGSVIINFLPVGFAKVFVESAAKKILMTNIMSVANENSGYDQCQYVETFGKYLKTEKPFDMVVMADLEKLNQVLLKRVLRYYKLEHSVPIKISSKKCGYRTVVADVAMIEKANMRLSERKLVSLFRGLRF